MTWETKVWGRTRELSFCSTFSKHELEVVAGGYCSLHLHRDRANRFIVKSGIIDVVELYGAHYKTTMLLPGASYEVPSLIPHFFVVHQTGVVYEEYFPDRGGEVKREDILRVVEGDLMTPPSLSEVLNRVIPGVPCLPIK
jgi:hypothetical protein